jgi:molybdopterin-binding protein
MSKDEVGLRFRVEDGQLHGACGGLTVKGPLAEIRAGLMKLSARNMLPGVVRKIEEGSVNAEVTIELAPKLEVVSIITLDSLRGLGLKVGGKAYAVIKASNVMVGVD